MPTSANLNLEVNGKLFTTSKQVRLCETGFKPYSVFSLRQCDGSLLGGMQTESKDAANDSKRHQSMQGLLDERVDESTLQLDREVFGKLIPIQA